MCGIGGIVGGQMRADERQTAALRLQSALAHRGPDDAGRFSAESATFVHARLAILDPTEGGRQPMTRGRFTITFNGEIYNFHALRDELRREGESFSTETDTEMILTLHARLGPACLPRLRGMFAFAIWDSRDRSCFLARDPFGIKPLYFASIAAGGFLFASELRALLATGLIPRRIDPVGLHGYLTTGSVPEPHTMIEGIECLPAGQTLLWRDEKSTTGSFFHVGFAGSPGDAEPLGLRDTLADSVQHHLMSDVPVGLLLSGGLDSSSILALASEHIRGRVATFSIGVEDSSLDEADAASALARHFGAQHHPLLLTQELARHWIDGFLDSIDQPTIDGFNIYCACKLASDHGYKVVLSGLGADELFGGYPCFRDVPRLRLAGEILHGLAPAARILESFSSQARARRACEFLGGPPNLARAYRAFRGVFTRRESESIGRALGMPWPSRGGVWTTPAGEREPPNLGDAISQLELTHYLRNQLLRDADVMSMAHGVELRTPLLDVPLFETLRRIPAERRLAPAKQILRDAMPEIPSDLLAARKQGFSLPFSRWLENEWSDLGVGLPMEMGTPLSPWYRKWSLIVLTRWLDKNGLRKA